MGNAGKRGSACGSSRYDPMPPSRGIPADPRRINVLILPLIHHLFPPRFQVVAKYRETDDPLVFIDLRGSIYEVAVPNGDGSPAGHIVFADSPQPTSVAFGDPDPAVGALAGRTRFFQLWTAAAGVCLVRRGPPATGITGRTYRGWA